MYDSALVVINMESVGDDGCIGSYQVECEDLLLQGIIKVIGSGDKGCGVGTISEWVKELGDRKDVDAL